MKLKRFLLCAGILQLVLMSVNVQGQVQKIFVLPKSTASIGQSQIVDSLRFIPLQGNGAIPSSVNTVQVTKDFFIVVDFQKKLVLLFKKDGSFDRSISFKRIGDGFFFSYSQDGKRLIFFGNNKNYSLTPKDRIKISLDWNNPRSKKYFKKFAINLDDPELGLHEEVVSQQDVLNSHPLGNGKYWRGSINTSTLYTDTLDYELKIYKDNALENSYFPYNHVTEPRFLFSEESISLSSLENSGTYIISRPYCDTLYKMENDSLFPFYQFVFPLENKLPESFFHVPFKNKTERENFRSKNGWKFRQVYGLFETPSFIYFNISYLTNYDAYIYQKKTNSIFRVRNVKPDINQFNIKLFGEYGTTRSGSKFYRMVRYEEFMKFFDQNKNTPVPVELKDFIKSNPGKDASILVEFSFKN